VGADSAEPDAARAAAMERGHRPSVGAYVPHARDPTPTPAIEPASSSASGFLSAAFAPRAWRDPSRRPNRERLPATGGWSGRCCGFAR